MLGISLVRECVVLTSKDLTPAPEYIRVIFQNNFDRLYFFLATFFAT